MMYVAIHRVDFKTQFIVLSIQYDFLHAVPPMGPLNVMKGQPIADDLGWVDVDKLTLRHKKYGKN